MIAGHLLHHDEIGIGVGEELGDVADPVIVVPDIEGHDPEETRGSRRCLLRSALQGEREMGAVDDHKKGGEDREHPAARERSEDEHDERARQKKWEPVIDDVERGKPPGKEPKQGQDRADHEPGRGERFHNEGHDGFAVFLRARGSGAGGA